MTESSLNKDYKDITFIPFSPQAAYSKASSNSDIVSVPNLEEIIKYSEKADSNFASTLEALQNITGYLEESSNSLEGIELTANKIFKIIERENTSIMKTLKAYSLPDAISKIIITRVITLALLYGCQMPVINYND